MKWLVTGFGPFEKVSENVTGLVAPLLNEPFQILEVSYQAVDDFLESLDPDSFECMLCLGHDKRAKRVRIELMGHNEIGPRKDVRGYVPSKTSRKNLPNTVDSALWNSLELSDCDDWTLSDNAGSYLCNYILFRASLVFPNHRIGFLHLPPKEVVPPENQAQIIRKLMTLVQNRTSVC